MFPEDAKGGRMPKYYVESGWVRMVLDARSAEQAAVKAFQRCRERQAEIYAEPPSGIIRDAEAVEWQLTDEITVNEIGFGGTDGETFDSFEIAAVWQAYAFTGHRSESGPVLRGSANGQARRRRSPAA
jgi:hypothetical protein